MSCGRENPITAYLDGELDLAGVLELERHLEDCAPCGRQLEAQRALRQAISAADLAYRPAPEQLSRLHVALGFAPLASLAAMAPIAASGPMAAQVASAGDDAGAAGAAAVATRPPGAVREFPLPRRAAAAGSRFWQPHRLRAVAALLLVAVGGWMVGRRWPAAGPAGAAPGAAATAGSGVAANPLAAELVSSHVRSLLASRPEDVVSSDRHTVKPWFAGRIDYSPPVVDLAAWQFPLRGARLEYVADRPVAALTYQVGHHVVSVFVWPADEPLAGAPGSVVAPRPVPSAAAQSGARRGYQVEHWTQAGMTWWAISDAAADHVDAFVTRLRQEVGNGG